jgi:hypothetical protein
MTTDELKAQVWDDIRDLFICSSALRAAKSCISMQVQGQISDSLVKRVYQIEHLTKNLIEVKASTSDRSHALEQIHAQIKESG